MAGAIFVIAVVARLLVALELSGSPLFDLYVGDSLYYHEWALRLAAGESDKSVFFQAPLYPYFLGALYWLFSPDPWTPRVVQAILAGAGCMLLSLSAFRLFGRRAGWIAGLLAALYAPGMFYDLLIHKSGIALLLGSLIVFFVTRFLAGNRTMLATAVMGGVTALAAMAIEHYLIVVPVMVVWMLVSRTIAWQQRMRWVCGLLLGVSLVQVPFIARNYMVAGEPVVASSSAGLNFWIGNGRGASGHYRSISSNPGNIQFEQQDSMRIASMALGRQVSGGEASRWWLDRAWREIAAQPSAWFRLMVKKAGLALLDFELPDEDAFGAYAAESRILNTLGGILRFGMLLPFFAIGAVVLWNTKEESRPIIAASMAILCGVILFFVFGRYRYAAAPFMFVVAGSGAAAFASMSRGKLAAAIAGIAACVIAFLPLKNSHNAHLNNYLLVGERAYALNRFDLAKGMALRTLPLAPPNWAAPYDLLAQIYLQTGEWEMAEINIRRVIAVQPDFPKAYNLLGQILLNVGDARARMGDVDGAIKSYSEVASMGGAVDADRQSARSRLERLAR